MSLSGCGSPRRLQTLRDVFLIALSTILIINPAVAGEVPFRSETVQLDQRSPIDLAVDLDELVQQRADDAEQHILVQFDRTVGPDLRDQLARAGLTLGAYVSNNAFFATVDRDALDPAAVVNNTGLVSAVPIETTWKLHPMLVEGRTPTWAVVGMTAEQHAIVGAYVVFHRDVPLNEGRALAESFGAVVRDELESINGLVLEIELDAIPSLADDDNVEWAEPALPRLSEVNDSNRTLTGVDVVQDAPYYLDGTGVTVLVYDGGTARSTHVDFEGRLTVHDSSGMANHATHVCGTVGGAGVANSAYKGMAPAATLLSYGFEYDYTGVFLYSNPGDIESDYAQAINTYGAEIANNSIGTNTATNGFDCDITGDYGATSQVIDTIVRGDGSDPDFDEPFRVIWANGNERQTSRCGDTYFTTAPPACAKNHITVGAVNSDDDSITSFTSWGPVDDGRLKPDIAGPGCQNSGDGGVTSCSYSGDSAYTIMCGTSMASPTVCGLSALIIQDFKTQYAGQAMFRNSTLKCLLAHTAVDCGNTGPDYQFGYGSVRVQPAIELMRAGEFLENSVDNGDTYTRTFVVPSGASEFKVTLAWDDYPATPNADPALVNDLDLVVTDPSSGRHYPWTLDPDNPSNAAVRTAEDHTNNIEQVYVANPAAGTWTIEVYGYNVPESPQPFSLVGDGAANAGLFISFPSGLPDYITPGTPTTIDVTITPVGENVLAGSATLYYRYDGGTWNSSTLTQITGTSYEATLPAASCSDNPEYYFSVLGTVSGLVYSPSNAPTSVYSATVGEWLDIFSDDFETDQGWTVYTTATEGFWERGVPVNNNRGDPPADYDGSGQCYLTENDESDDNSDIDDGYTQLTSPLFDLSDGATVSYAYWLNDVSSGSMGDEDAMTVEVATNAASNNWTTIRSYDEPSSVWRTDSIEVGSEVTATSTIRFRITARDDDPQNVVEAGLDAFVINSFSCDGTETGACCYTDGSCLVQTADDCSAAGGTYEGNDTVCDPNPCPQPEGACCLADGSCVIRTIALCNASAGTYQGDGTDCDPNPCPQPTGACCYEDGSCLVQTEADCIAAGGAYEGNDTVCDPNPCPQPTGACCYEDGSCLVQTEADCIAAGGAYEGDDTVCNPNPCPQPTGACCYEDGSCLVQTEADCIAAGGAYEGNDTVCDPNPCPQPTGACCYEDGSCLVQTEADCIAAGGAYEGDDTVCNPNPCPQPEGACCYEDGSCLVQTEADCIAAGGAYEGDDTVCNPNPCPQPTTGACCQAGYACEVLTADDCDAAGGAYMGDDTTCDDANANGVADICECHGDSNCDGTINFDDIDFFVAALVAEMNWEDMFTGTPPCDFLHNDCNWDGSVNFDDIDPFVEALVNGECILMP